MQNNQKGFTPKEKRPTPDNARIWFIDKETNERFEGLWIEVESMFYIGFEDRGYFRFAHEISKWGYLDETHEPKPN
jgi:hypothetical protein